MRRWLRERMQPQLVLGLGLFFGLTAFAVGAHSGSWPFLVVAAVGFALAGLGWTEAVRRYREDQRELDGYTGRCPNCGYDLTGNVTGVCPECGTARQ